MEIVSGLTITGESVCLDDKHFVDCTLDDCELTYSGGHVIFERTKVTACEYKFFEDAGRTFELLKLLGLVQQSMSSEITVGELIN